MRPIVVLENVLRKDILPLMSVKLQRTLLRLFSQNSALENKVTEIRVRAGLPLCVVTPTEDVLIEDSPPPSQHDIKKTLALIADCSYYALDSEFSNGYITLPGGHRVGLSGQASLWGEGKVRLREVNSFCIRVARDVKGAADKIVSKLVGSGGRFKSTLIISPPGCGKTTLLRDLCRHASRGNPKLGLLPSQVGIVDERSEIAAVVDGVPQHDVGPRVDVLDRWPKAKGIVMLLRSMSPRVIATDEIGSEEDARAVTTALTGGVTVLATCHGDDVESVMKRPYSSWLVAKGFFEMAVVLSNRNGPGTIEYVGEMSPKKVRGE